MAARGGKNGAVAPSVYDQLSAVAKKSYDKETWDATTAEIMEAVAGGQARPVVAKQYAISVADIALLM